MMREEASGGGADCTKIVLYEAGGSQTMGRTLVLPLPSPLPQRQLGDPLSHILNFRLVFVDLIQAPNHGTVPG